MPFPWSGKREPGEADGPELFDDSERPATGGRRADAGEVTEGLAELAKVLGRASETIAELLARSRSESARAANAAVAELSAGLEALERKIDQLAAREAPDSPPPLPGASPAPAASKAGTTGAAASPAVAEALERIERRLDQIAGAGAASTGAGPSEAIARLERQLDDGMRQLAERLAPPRKVETAPASNLDWERALLGPRIAQNPNLAFQRQQILRGVLDGEAATRSLAGLLLAFQSAPPERMPQLLKDIGEAFYRWQPKTHAGTNPMEESLVAWLQSVCDDAGIGNRIELVHPGERFDSTRHNALSRGVEVADVQGWIVLRDNGKVYTKATVTAR